MRPLDSQSPYSTGSRLEVAVTMSLSWAASFGGTGWTSQPTSFSISGAASGVATQYMARPDTQEVGLFGSGKQARTQLLAVCKVRRVNRVQVYSPNEERRRRFCTEMEKEVGCEVQPVPRPEMAAEDKDIVITATSSREPVLFGVWLSEGDALPQRHGFEFRHQGRGRCGRGPAL